MHNVGCSWSILNEVEKSGRCCCNCRWQRSISGHPWNKNELTKGPITSIIGYGCAVPDMPNIVFFEKSHGMCELHEWKNTVTQMKRVK